MTFLDIAGMNRPGNAFPAKVMVLWVWTWRLWGFCILDAIFYPWVVFQTFFWSKW
jgi:hypothetical protein